MSEDELELEQPFEDEPDIDERRVCGVPYSRINAIPALLSGAGSGKLWHSIRGQLISFNKEHALMERKYKKLLAQTESASTVALDAASMKTIFAQIDADTADPRIAYRRKVQAGIQQIDPILFVNSLAQAVAEGEPWARKLLADIIGLTRESVQEAGKEQAPSVSFEYKVAESAPKPPAPPVEVKRGRGRPPKNAGLRVV